MIETSNGNVYCERCLKRLTKAEDLLNPRFIRGEKCRKIFDERSKKANNDIFGMANK